MGWEEGHRDMENAWNWVMEIFNKVMTESGIACFPQDFEKFAH